MLQNSQNPLYSPPSSSKPSSKDNDYHPYNLVVAPPLSVNTSALPSINSINLPPSPSSFSRPPPNSTRVPSAGHTNRPESIQPSPSSSSCPAGDILVPGDIVSEGCSLQGEPIRLVSVNSQFEPGGGGFAQEFEVVRRLGQGSYAVVYLVKEVLSRCPLSEDGHLSTTDSMELDENIPHQLETVYGRECAIKCLPKVDLDNETLGVLLTEVCLLSFLWTLVDRI